MSELMARMRTTVLVNGSPQNHSWRDLGKPRKDQAQEVEEVSPQLADPCKPPGSVGSCVCHLPQQHHCYLIQDYSRVFVHSLQILSPRQECSVHCSVRDKQKHCVAPHIAGEELCLPASLRRWQDAPARKEPEMLGTTWPVCTTKRKFRLSIR